MERCPSCRARLNDSPFCSRCGCNLEHVFNAQAQAEDRFRHGIQAWACKRHDQALAHFQAAMSLHSTPLLAALMACLAQSPQSDSLPVQESAGTETLALGRFSQALTAFDSTLKPDL